MSLLIKYWQIETKEIERGILGILLKREIKSFNNNKINNAENQSKDMIKAELNDRNVISVHNCVSGFLCNLQEMLSN